MNFGALFFGACLLCAVIGFIWSWRNALRAERWTAVHLLGMVWMTCAAIAFMVMIEWSIDNP